MEGIWDPDLSCSSNGILRSEGDVLSLAIWFLEIIEYLDDAGEIDESV